MWITIGAGASMVSGLVLAAVAGRSPAAIVAGIAIAAAHAASLATSSGRRVPLTVAVAAAAALISRGSLTVLVSAGLFGLPLGAFILLIHRGPRPARDLVPSQAAGYAAFVAVASPLHRLVAHDSESSWVHLVVVGGGAIAWFVVENLVHPITTGSRRRIGRRLLVRRGFSEWQVFAALVAIGTIFGITVPALGWWAVPLAAIPFLFTHLALDRALQTSTTYRQTIRALGRTPEAGGLSPAGHSDRTADLAVAMGAELGLSSAELERVEEAAYLHDIGRLVLNDPSVAGAGYSTRDLAQWSAAIVSEVPHLRPVADVVADHHRPYRRPGEARDRAVAPSAQLIKIASAYAVAHAGGMTPADSLEILHRGSAYDYDPDLVAVLRRVLLRRGDVMA
jgi:HD superfamily phosphodiesterase